jgi:hypothetical protein
MPITRTTARRTYDERSSVRLDRFYFHRHCFVGHVLSSQMKILPIFLLLSGCAATPEQLRVVYHVTNAADVATSIDGLNRGCREANPFLSGHPSSGEVAAIGLLYSALYEVIYHSMRDRPEGDRKAFGWALLVVKAIGPINNLTVSCNH